MTFAAQVGKDDKMFGSVTAKDIAEGLAEQGFTVDRRKIQLAQPIKELGTHAIAVKLPREVTATIAVHVVKKQDEHSASRAGRSRTNRITRCGIMRGHRTEGPRSEEACRS
jgi:large subunit ribosomal protein L9